jgi:hypothetical protein
MANKTVLKISKAPQLAERLYRAIRAGELVIFLGTHASPNPATCRVVAKPGGW